MAAAAAPADNTAYDYDLFCIGAGSGGVRASRMSASHGAKVAVRVICSASLSSHRRLSRGGTDRLAWPGLLLPQVCELPFSATSSDSLGGAGGTCVIRGCVPKKLLVFGAHYAEEFKDSRGFGWRPADAGSPAHDWTALIASKDAEIKRLSGVYNRILANAGVTVRPRCPAPVFALPLTRAVCLCAVH